MSSELNLSTLAILLAGLASTEPRSVPSPSGPQWSWELELEDEHSGIHRLERERR